jgi:YVTN family beta-propeller protein
MGRKGHKALAVFPKAFKAAIWNTVLPDRRREAAPKTPRLFLGDLSRFFREDRRAPAVRVRSGKRSCWTVLTKQALHRLILQVSNALGLFLAVATVFSACVKDRPNPGAKNIPPSDSNRKVFIVCEGSFGSGSASLDVYLPVSDSFYNDVYRTINGQPLGDVFQSMVQIWGRYFLCINNSDRITVINAEDLKTVGMIAVPKPRYILPISATKAYVSTLFSDKVYVINPQTLEVIGSITMPYQNPEGMLLKDGKAYICTWDTACSKVFVLDAATDQIVDELTIPGRAPLEVVPDKDGNLWVMAGNVAKKKPATLSCIQASSGTVLKSYAFPENADPLRMVFNRAGDSLYFIEVNYNGGAECNGIYRMPLDASDLPAQPFLQAAQFQYFWALGIDPVTGHVFVGDPRGFIQKGSVSVYDAGGKLIRQFPAGVGPGHFYFTEP